VSAGLLWQSNHVTDWRDTVVDGITFTPGDLEGADPLNWPGYEPRCSVSWGVGDVPGRAALTQLPDAGVAGDPTRAVVCVWDFSVYGGSFGTAETNALAAAVDAAVAAGLPLVTWARTGGTRLQEGMGALVGIPSSLLAMRRLSEAHLAHIAIADHPTTGGVWVGITSPADIRVGVAGATVGFSGPRVVAAMTGEPLPPGEHTAESAHRHGLLDAVVTPSESTLWLARALRAVSGRAALPDGGPLPPVEVSQRDGWSQVVACREAPRPSGAELMGGLLTDAIPLHGTDPAVSAAVGLLHGHSAVAVALSAHRGQRPGPAGYALAVRAAQLAGRLDWPMVTLIDTPGADPRPHSEHNGIAAWIGTLMDAVLRCPSPTVAVVHGEGGSGGALAAAVADRVLVSPLGYFAAIAPEGAAQALKTDPRTAAELGEMTPERLLRMGIADGMTGSDPPGVTSAVTAALRSLMARDPAERMSERLARWTAGTHAHGSGSLS